MESDKDKLRKAVNENDDDAVNNLLSIGVLVDKDIVAMDCHQQDMKPAYKHPENRSEVETIL